MSFFSDRYRLDGDLYLPDGAGPGNPAPAVVACSGYTGLKDIHPARFARALVPRGYACVAFDYRGHGRSEGERGRIAPREEAADVAGAVGLCENVAEVDSGRIALLGWALGGGVVVAAAADDPRVQAVVAVNAVADNGRVLRHNNDEASWARLVKRVAVDRTRRAVTGRSELVDPFEIERLDLDPVTHDYVGDQLYPYAGFGSGVSLESADYLLRFRPELVAGRIAPRPMLIVHGASNGLHPPDEARALHAAAGSTSELVLLDGAGHTEWMYDDHPTFVELVEQIDAFLSFLKP